MEEFKVPTLPPPAAAAAESKTEAELKEIPQPNAEEKSTTLANKLPAPSSKSPATASSSCPYKIPTWSQAPAENYSFEVLKSGQIIDSVKELQQKPYWTFGRLPENDVEMAHPTISRYHAVLQYRPAKELDLVKEDDDEEETEQKKSPAAGWYIYDLGSTHGTFLNKQRVPAKVYIRMRVGHMLKLGASTRCYILQGPEEDEEPESELSVTELKQQRQRQVEEAAATELRKQQEEEERKRNEGVSWGMDEDADEETDLSHNPYASTNNEELFLDDPKKTLRGYFEREGLDLEYKCDEMSAGSFVCRVELPLDDAMGRPLIAEVVHKGKKKECVVQCALEACRILDRHGVLRQSTQEPLKKRMKRDSDSDEDDFWDRTGDVERKKQRKAQAGSSVTLTYEDLLKQQLELEEKQKQIDAEIANFQANQKRIKDSKAQQEKAADLDNFMDNLCKESMQLDKTEIRKLRLQQQRFIVEQQKLQRLIKIAKPAALPNLNTAASSNSLASSSLNKKQMPLIGKRNQFSKFKLVKAPMPKSSSSSKNLNSDEEEMEDDFETKNTKIAAEIVPNITKSKEQDLTKEQHCNLDEKLPDEIIESSVCVKQSTKVDAIAKHKVEEKLSSITSEPANEDNETIKQAEHSMAFECKSKETKATDEIIDASSEPNTEDAQAASKSKRRTRQRPRNKYRPDVDCIELDEQESSEKYAKWVPPENQTGDGMTELNKKYGY